MIRLCHLITGLGVGGAEQALTRLCHGLADRGYEQRVIVMLPPGPMATGLNAAGCEPHSLGLRPGRPDPRGLTRLASELRRFRPDLLMTWMYHADLLGTLVRPVAPVARLVWNLRCTVMPDRRPWGRGSVIRTLALLSGVPDAVIANSAAGQADHAARGYRPRRWACIRNGVDTDRFTPAIGSRRAKRARLGLPESGPVIGMIARFDPQKDHATFFAAAARFVRARPDAHFLLVGKGCTLDHPPFRELVASRGLVGAVSALGIRDDLPELYQACDLTTLSSAYGEGTPNVLLESLACGIPAVATEVGDSRLVIGLCGQVVPPRDPAALCDAWATTLNADLSAAARARAVTMFPDAAISASYDALLRSLIHPPRSAPVHPRLASKEI